MFTGIITHTGIIDSIEKKGDWKLRIAVPKFTHDIVLGASVACSGACLTVIKKDKGGFFVQVSGETLSRTTLSQWKKGTRINLERALKVGDELGGHFVTGHVDGLAMLEDIKSAGDSKIMWLSSGPSLRDATKKIVQSLTPREQQVLSTRFGIGADTDHALEEIGQQFSGARERIRQIEEKALRKLGKHGDKESKPQLPVNASPRRGKVRRGAAMAPTEQQGPHPNPPPLGEGKRLSRFIAAKGSVTLDGVSLTVNEVEGDRFAVNIIPHTQQETTLGERRKGDMLNLEIDLIARYLARLKEA